MSIQSLLRREFPTTRFLAVLGSLSLALSVPFVTTQSASADAVVADLNLGTAASYSVLGASTVTNTGSSVLSRSVGVSPGTAITGFPPGRVRPPGTINRGGAAAAQAQADALVAYGDARLRPSPEQVPNNLADANTVGPGLYTAAGPLALTGTITLDGRGDPAAVFIFQSRSTLIVGSSSRVLLTGGAQACHVYWQVAESSTIGTGTAFVGTILAQQSISLATGATLQGRAIALVGAVTLQRNTITNGSCTSAPGSTSSSAPTSTSPTSTPPTSTSTSTIGPTATGPTAGPTVGPTGPTETTGPTVTSPIGRGAPTNTIAPTSVSPTDGTSTATSATGTSSTTTSSTDVGGISTGTSTAIYDSPQIPITPVGGVQTGGGATSNAHRSFLAVLGALVLLMASALVMAGLRRSRR